MEDSVNISDSLSAKSGQINDIMTSLPQGNNVEKGDGFEDEKKLLVDDETREEKEAQTESLQVESRTEMLDPVASEGKSEMRETSTHELNGVGTDEQTTTEIPNINALASEKHENLLSSNIEEEEDIASNTSAGLDQLISVQQTNSELSVEPESNVSSKHSSESSGVEGGSHRSPDRKSKVEYRKIKSEVTGEGETSESEGEENNKETTENGLENSAHDGDQAKDTWMDILGNGLLKKRVIYKHTCHWIPHPYPPKKRLL